MKIGQRVKYKEEYLGYKPLEDIELGINEYTIMNKEENDYYLYKKNNKREIHLYDINWCEYKDRLQPLKQAVHTKTQEGYNAVMEYMESLDIGAKWISRGNPTKYNTWDVHKEKTCVDISDLTGLSYCKKDYFKENNYSIITTQEYLRDWKDNPLEEPKSGQVQIADGKGGWEWKDLRELTEKKPFSIFYEDDNGVYHGGYTGKKNNEAPELHKKSGNIMNLAKAKILRAFSKDERELYKAGLIDDNNKPTSELIGTMQKEILEAHYKENKKSYVELAKEINKQ